MLAVWHALLMRMSCAVDPGDFKYITQQQHRRFTTSTGRQSDATLTLIPVLYGTRPRPTQQSILARQPVRARGISTLVSNPGQSVTATQAYSPQASLQHQLTVIFLVTTITIRSAVDHGGSVSIMVRQSLLHQSQSSLRHRQLSRPRIWLPALLHR